MNYDFIVIGAGQAAMPFVRAAAERGKKVALIEKDKFGGSCVNYGCTPTKTLVAAAKVAYQSRRAEEFGVMTKGVGVDMKRVKERMNKVRGAWQSGSERSVERYSNIDVHRGVGVLRGSNEVAVGDRILTAETIVLNTGTRARIPEIKGIDQVEYLTNKEILELEELPERLIIVGGGYIGLEFAQIFRRFGSEVTVVHRGAQLLSREDLDVAEEVRQILEEEGVNFMLSSTPVEIRNGIELMVQTPDGVSTISGSHLLLAAGRTPNSDMLNLNEVGVVTDSRGFIQVDNRFRTSVPSIYAVGDVKGGPAFTHISYDDYRILGRILLDGDDISLDSRPVPYVVFIDPQLGRVGMSEKEARASAVRYRVARIRATSVSRAYESNETRGSWKILVDPETREILGCAILGMEGGEVMSIVQTAMQGGLTYDFLENNIWAHPTLAESLNNIFMHGLEL